MPYFPNSTAADRLYDSNAALLAPYEIDVGKQSAASVLTLIILPQDAFLFTYLMVNSFIINATALLLTSKCLSWLKEEKANDIIPVDSSLVVISTSNVSG